MHLKVIIKQADIKHFTLNLILLVFSLDVHVDSKGKKLILGWKLPNIVYHPTKKSWK